MKPKTQIIRSLLIFLLLLVPQLALAAVPRFVPCGNGGVDTKCTLTDLFVLVARFTNFLIIFAGAFAVVQIIRAGFGFIISGGKEENITTNKKAVSNAVVGFVLVMLAFLVVNLMVNGIFGLKLNLTRPLCYVNPGAAGCTQ